jgi:glucosamine 6-phosphate synthetase-like amidotransferase/phosphosugar isomerase protein
MVKLKIQAMSLDDLQTVLEEGVSLIAHVFKVYRGIIEDGGELTVAQEKALTSHITCLYQTNKDYRATKREIEKEISDMTEAELKKLVAMEDEQQDNLKSQIMGIIGKN